MNKTKKRILLSVLYFVQFMIFTFFVYLTSYIYSSCDNKTWYYMPNVLFSTLFAITAIFSFPFTIVLWFDK
jgi:hypothetical protein